MINGLDLNATIDYKLPEDKENPTIWKLGVVPSYLFLQITQEAKGNEIKSAYRLLQISLRGWDNFNIPFETVKEKFIDREMDIVPISVLEKIPLNVISALAAKSMEVNQISISERKN